MGVSVADAVGVCGACVGITKEALAALIGISPLNHKVPSVAPIATRGTRINSAVMTSTLRAERFGLAGRGFVAALLPPSSSCAACVVAPIATRGIGGTVAGQAGVPGGKYEKVAERTGDPHVWQKVADAGSSVLNCGQVIGWLPSILVSVFCLNGNQSGQYHYDDQLQL